MKDDLNTLPFKCDIHVHHQLAALLLYGENEQKEATHDIVWMNMCKRTVDNINQWYFVIGIAEVSFLCILFSEKKKNENILMHIYTYMWRDSCIKQS